MEKSYWYSLINDLKVAESKAQRREQVLAEICRGPYSKQNLINNERQPSSSGELG
jgi:hypothetical protein